MDILRGLAQDRERYKEEYCIYQWTYRRTNMKYIGKATQKVQERILQQFTAA